MTQRDFELMDLDRPLVPVGAHGLVSPGLQARPERREVFKETTVSL